MSRRRPPIRRAVAAAVVALAAVACSGDDDGSAPPPDTGSGTATSGSSDAPTDASTGVTRAGDAGGDPSSASTTTATSPSSLAPDADAARLAADDVVGRRWRIVAIDGVAPFGAPWVGFDPDGDVAVFDGCEDVVAGTWTFDAPGGLVVEGVGSAAAAGNCGAAQPVAVDEAIVGEWSSAVSGASLRLDSATSTIELADDLGGDGVRPAGFDLVPARVVAAGGEVCDVCLWTATNDDERSRGLMEVTELGPAAGMAFVYDRPQARSFVMRNTVVPLTIAFFDAEGVYLDEFDMVPCESEPCQSYPTPVMQVAVEVFAGTAAGVGIGPGAELELLAGPCPTQA